MPGLRVYDLSRHEFDPLPAFTQEDKPEINNLFP